MTLRATRTLALQPTRWGAAFAVLEGSGALLDWGTFRVDDDRAFPKQLDALQERYEPQLVVFEDLRGSQRGDRARERLADVLSRAGVWGVSSASVSRARVRAMFPATAGTKIEVARAIARSFPQLRRRLPNKRKPWLPEDKRMSVFDAVSFALTVLRELEDAGPVGS